MANANLHKRHTEHFCASSYRLRFIDIFITFDLKNISICQVVDKLELLRSISNIVLHKNHKNHIGAIFYRLRDINILNC